MLYTYYLQYYTSFTENSDELNEALNMLDELAYNNFFPALTIHAIVSSSSLVDARFVMTLGIEAESLLAAKKIMDTEPYNSIVEEFGLTYFGYLAEGQKNKYFDTARDKPTGSFESGNEYNMFNTIPHNGYLFSIRDLLSSPEYDELQYGIKPKHNKKNKPALIDNLKVLQQLLALHPDVNEEKYPFLKALASGLFKPTKKQAALLAKEFKVSPSILLKDEPIAEEKLEQLKSLIAI